LAKGRKAVSHGMAPPADSREALQWFVNTYGLYMGSVRGLFLSDWNEEQAVSLEAAVINLRGRGFAPFTVAGETLYQQADFLFQESQSRGSFGRPMASKVELELSGNDIVVVDGLEAPEKPHHLWYLWSYLLFPRVISGKVTILTTPLAYQEFIKYGHACPDFDFLGQPINWEKLVWLLECSTINQDLYKLAREESVPPMLKPEYNLYTALKDRNLDPVPQCVLGDYLLDFALIDKEQKLNIECDALSALSGHEIHTKEARRDLVLLSDGWQILKFSSAEILNNRTACSDVIEDIWRGGRKRSHCGRYLSGKSLPQTPELPDDDAQRSAIIFGGGPIAVVGGAGTGKTACLSQRCAYLLSQGISPENILMISYSADSARVLKQTIAPLVEKPVLQRLNVMSWQDLGLKILKENLPAIKRKPPIKLETSPQKVIQKLLGKIKKEVDATKLEMAGDLDEFYLAAMIGMYKSHLISPKKAREDAHGDAEEIIARIYQSYEDQLQKANRIDKHDVTALAVQVLLDNAEARLKYQTQYEFILVDEYQDVTVAQDIFIRLLAAPQDNLFVAGDEDETISENRNSCPELLADFTLRFPHGRCVVLEQNWRSHPALVDHSRLLISHLDRSKIRKEYVSAWGQSPGMAVFGPQVCADEAEESRWVAAQVKALLDAGRSARDIAILYRQNKYEPIIEDELGALNVRFRASHSDSSMIPDEVGDMLAFLKLVMDPDGPKAREAFERVCQLGTKEIDPKLSATISSFASANSLSYLKAVEIYAEATADQGCRELEQLVRIIRAMNQDRLPPAESIGYLRRTRRLNDYYKGIKIPPGQSYEPLKKLGQLEEDARKFTSVSEFIKHAEEKQGEEDDTGDDQTVHIKSVYDVKGFEFPIVFMVGLAQGLFPVDNADDLEEERRQFYVAFTRAREALYLSYPARFADKDRAPSLFLIETQLVAMSAFELAQASAAAAAQAEILARQQHNIEQIQPPAPSPPVITHPTYAEPVQPQVAYVEPQGAQIAPAAHLSNQPHVQSVPAQTAPQEAAPPPAPPPPPVQTHLHAPITAEMQGVAAGSAYDQEEIRKGLSPFVDNPEPILSRGMDYLPPSKGVSQEPNSSPPPQGSQPDPQASQNQSPVPYPPRPPQPPQMPTMPAARQGPKVNSSFPPQPDQNASQAVDKTQPAASSQQGAEPREPVAPSASSRANKNTSELPPLSQPAQPVAPQVGIGPPLTNTPNVTQQGSASGPMQKPGAQNVQGDLYNPPQQQAGYQPPQTAGPTQSNGQQGSQLQQHQQVPTQQKSVPQPPQQIPERPVQPQQQQQAVPPQAQLPQQQMRPQGPTQIPPQPAYVDPNSAYPASQNNYANWQAAYASSPQQLSVSGGCPSCQMPLEPGARFCGECGYSIPAEPPPAMPQSNYPEDYAVNLQEAYVEMLVCGVCANVLEPGAKFCGECGTPYQAQQDLPPNAQRVPDGNGGWMVKFLKFLEE
jgi:DNA helicase II / ATP-dependent DNA helicase PcrA